MNEKERKEERTRFWLNQIYTQRLRDTDQQGEQMPPSIFTVYFSVRSFFFISLIPQVDWAFVSACWCLFYSYNNSYAWTAYGNSSNTHFWCRWMKKNRTGSSHIKKANEWEKKWAAYSHAKHKVQNIQMENYIRKFNSVPTSIHQIKFNALVKWLFAANCSFAYDMKSKQHGKPIAN